MYNENEISRVVKFLEQNHGIDKDVLKTKTMNTFNLTRDRSVYYCNNYAIFRNFLKFTLSIKIHP